MNNQTILVVDDEPDICGLLQEILEDEGFDVSVARTAQEARRSIAEHTPSLVLLDIWMPDEDGVSLLKSWKQDGKLDFPVIMISGHGTVETAVEATRYGAVDFIEKPVSLAKLLLTIEKALAEFPADSAGEDGAGRRMARLAPMIGDSSYMKELRNRLSRLAASASNVLIQGESGAGCALFSQHLHAQSGGSGPYIQLRCDSLSAVNSQRELCGSEENGAVSAGYLESANHGTLYLSDIELMPSAAQATLLEALRHSGFYRVGATRRVGLNARMVASSRVELRQRVEQGGFDADLYKLLAVEIVNILPLREHREDISALLESLVNWHVEQEGLPYRHFTVAAQNRLRSLDWPGNLMELKNLVQRMLILGGTSEIDVGEVDRVLGNETRPTGQMVELRSDLPLREARAHFEKQYLIRCLIEAQGNMGELARHVGMERTHLYRKLRSLDIDLEKLRE